MTTGKLDPWRIDSLIVPDTLGQIGMMACPGGRHLRAIHNDQPAGLDQDLEGIRNWGATGLVSLIEDHELAWVGITDLPEKVGLYGLWWRHLAIRDMGIPDRVFEEKWRLEGARLRQLLTEGERFVIHCLAGLGRTGTIAARLLIELGTEPTAAIQQVRSARPGTIQSVQQEMFVLGCKRVD